MPHIHTQPGDHDPTASAIIIRLDTEPPRVLLHLHKKLGSLLQPGGHVEINENPWQAVLHEITEETGYDVNQLQVLQPKIRLKKMSGATLHPVPAILNTHNFFADGSHKHWDVVFAFTTNSAPKGMPAEGESSDIRWLTAQELTDLSPDTIFENVREIAQFVIAQILPDWESVDLSEFKKS